MSKPLTYLQACNLWKARSPCSELPQKAISRASGQFDPSNTNAAASRHASATDCSCQKLGFEVSLARGGMQSNTFITGCFTKHGPLNIACGSSAGQMLKHSSRCLCLRVNVCICVQYLACIGHVPVGCMYMHTHVCMYECVCIYVCMYVCR